MANTTLDRLHQPSVMTLKVTTDTSEQSVTIKMQAQFLYGPDIWFDIEPDTAVYVRRP